LFYIKKAYDLDVKSSVHWSIPYFYMGAIDDKNGNSLHALHYYRAGLKVATTKSEKFRGFNGMASIFKKIRMEDSAIYYSKRAITEGLDPYFPSAVVESSKLLTDIYKSRDMIDSAFIYQELMLAAKDSLFSQEKVKQMQSLSFSEQLRKQEEAEQQRELQNKVKLYSVLSALIVLLLLATIIIRNIILKRRNEKQRLEHKLELQQLESQRKEESLQHQATELEMQALRAQMNPHFIFNSLNSINMFILENNKLQASEYLSKFSRLVRLILQNSQEALIPLERELEALQLYLELESLRFENKCEYKISVSDDVDTTVMKVPPLIIQPYAENAIWHGLMHKKEKGHLEIELYLEKILFCKITDDGIGRKEATELKNKSTSTHKSIGMRITADRIAMLQQQKQNRTFISITDLVLPDGSSGGTEVLLKIPLCYD
jgi:LytS/YehU family sensor histidine kinase